MFPGVPGAPQQRPEHRRRVSNVACREPAEHMRRNSVVVEIVEHTLPVEATAQQRPIGERLLDEVKFRVEVQLVLLVIIAATDPEPASFRSTRSERSLAIGSRAAEGTGQLRQLLGLITAPGRSTGSSRPPTADSRFRRPNHPDAATARAAAATPRSAGQARPARHGSAGPLHTPPPCQAARTTHAVHAQPPLSRGSSRPPCAAS